MTSGRYCSLMASAKRGLAQRRVAVRHAARPSAVGCHRTGSVATASCRNDRSGQDSMSPPFGRAALYMRSSSTTPDDLVSSSEVGPGGGAGCGLRLGEALGLGVQHGDFLRTASGHRPEQDVAGSGQDRGLKADGTAGSGRPRRTLSPPQAVPCRHGRSDRRNEGGRSAPSQPVRARLGRGRQEGWVTGRHPLLDTRHTYASALLQAGCSVRSSRPGWGTPPPRSHSTRIATCGRMTTIGHGWLWTVFCVAAATSGVREAR